MEVSYVLCGCAESATLSGRQLFIVISRTAKSYLEYFKLQILCEGVNELDVKYR